MNMLLLQYQFSPSYRCVFVFRQQVKIGGEIQLPRKSVTFLIFQTRKCNSIKIVETLLIILEDKYAIKAFKYFSQKIS